MAWPFREDEWANLTAAQEEFLTFVEAIAETERVRLLVHPSVDAPPAPANVDVLRVAYGDSWTRDTAPIFTTAGEALVFRFDGWGGKYRMEGDEDLARRIAGLAECDPVEHEFIVEGGAVEWDGEGTLLTTQCLRERNPGLALDPLLKQAFGATRVVWLEGTLENDHTDGHIDTLARFVAPGRTLCMRGDASDPNRDALGEIETQLRDAGFEVQVLPSPGVVRGSDGALLPASYCNYYLANDQVLVPAYGVAADEEAARILRDTFPKRHVRTIPARFILEGGGALHCITQQQP
ncbi:MAG: agmatine deiminase family protein [Myxococcota bacterium]